MLCLTGCLETTRSAKSNPPAFTRPAPAVRAELEPLCWPLVDGIRQNRCPMTYEWFTRLMKLEAQLQANRRHDDETPLSSAPGLSQSRRL